MQSRIPVLIMGAGPTGLLMAYVLAQHGIAFRILDKKPERTLTTNAAGIQPRTLELLDTLGLVQDFLTLGHRCSGIQFHTNGKKLLRISLNNLDSFYHFILTLPQSETERLLTEALVKLQYDIERPIELTDLQQTNHTVICTVQDPEGGTETIECDWLLACDGANSKVRALCHIDFPGQDLSEQFMVANAEMSTFLPSTDIQGFLNKGSLLFAAPFGSQEYRIGVNLQQSPRKFLIEKEVKEIVQERSQGAYVVNSVSWISPFWIHSKIVSNLRQGSIFLAGDAAHIHSPAGAQGMNTGIQDAYNLAWKLALVVQGKAKPSLLVSYQEERYPVDQAIVKATELFTKMALVENPLLIGLRNLFFKLIQYRARTSNNISMQLTQLGFRYKKSSIIDYTEKLGRRAPRPGERAPDVLMNTSSRLYDYLRSPHHHILLFSGTSFKTLEAAPLRELQQRLNQTYAGTVKTYVVSEKMLEGMDPFILDEKGLIHQRYGVRSPALCVIRPDNYLAYCSQKMTLSSVKKFLERYLT